MKDWFKIWFDSHYYHLLYENRTECEAQEFVKNLTTHLEMSNKTCLLDVACGKGRHSLAFENQGIEVTGIDLSQNSIDYANQFSNERVHFYVHDMRQAFRSNYYDVVCNLFTSFGYFEKQHDNHLAAKMMFQALKPNGKLVIDFVNRQHAVKNIEANRTETIDRNEVRFFIERSYDHSQFLKTIKVQDKKECHTFHERLSSFTLTEMQNIFEKVGFTKLEAFGNYALEAYDENNSPRMILIFEKR